VSVCRVGCHRQNWDGEPVRVVSLPRLSIDAHGSVGVLMDFLPRVTAADRTDVHIAHIEAGGTLGGHPAPLGQVFAVVSGAGKVTTDHDQSRQIHAGQAVVWEPGEVHQSWALTDMLVMIIETTGDLTLDENYPEA